MLKIFEEAIQVQFPNALFNLFTYISIFHNPINARELFYKYKIYFYNPFIPTEIGEYIALKKISQISSNNGFTLTDFGLPTCVEHLEYEINFNEMDVPFEKDILEKYSINLLSTKQRKVFDTVMNSLNNVINYKNNKCYFIDEPGDSGKSYLLNSIITYLNQKKHFRITCSVD